jgi:hypothetical protein
VFFADRLSVYYCAEALKLKAIAVKKGLNLTVFSGLQEMGVLRCDLCGEEFVIGHSPEIADRKAAEKQAHWLEKVLADDHERQKKHVERIELPDSAEDRGASHGQERRSA